VQVIEVELPPTTTFVPGISICPNIDSFTVLPLTKLPDKVAFIGPVFAAFAGDIPLIANDVIWNPPARVAVAVLISTPEYVETTTSQYPVVLFIKSNVQVIVVELAFITTFVASMLLVPEDSFTVEPLTNEPVNVALIGPVFAAFVGAIELIAKGVIWKPEVNVAVAVLRSTPE